MRQAKFRISVSICVIWTQLLLDARTSYPYSAHRRLWSDCASVIRLHLANTCTLSIVLLRLISASHQVSLGTQTPHILSLAVIRVGVDVARQTKLSYIDLTLQKHALHQSCRSESPLYVLTVRPTFNASINFRSIYNRSYHCVCKQWYKRLPE